MPAALLGEKPRKSPLLRSICDGEEPKTEKKIGLTCAGVFSLNQCAAKYFAALLLEGDI